MTKKEKSHLKIKIQEELLILDKNIIELQKLCEPIAPECALGDLARFELIHDQEVSQKALSQALLRKNYLIYALSTISTEDFGLCSECEEEISFQRLLLLPESKFCIKCAKERH